METVWIGERGMRQSLISRTRVTRRMKKQRSAATSRRGLRGFEFMDGEDGRAGIRVWAGTESLYRLKGICGSTLCGRAMTLAKAALWQLSTFMGPLCIVVLCMQVLCIFWDSCELLGGELRLTSPVAGCGKPDFTVRILRVSGDSGFQTGGYIGFQTVTDTLLPLTWCLTQGVAHAKGPESAIGIRDLDLSGMCGSCSAALPRQRLNRAGRHPSSFLG